MTQTYSQPIARERMSLGLCPECGDVASAHSSSPYFWMRGSGCDLLPEGVNDRLAQYRSEVQS